MRIFVDMDGTLNNFLVGYLNYYNHYFNEKVSLEDEDLLEYEIIKCIPNVDQVEARRRMNIIFETPGFWRNIPPRDGAAKALQWLYNNHETYILTAPWTPFIHCASEKLEWVKTNFPFFKLDNVIMSAHKHLFSGGVLIDDRPNYLKCWNGKKIAYHHPFNMNCDVDGRIFEWRDVKEVINNI